MINPRGVVRVLLAAPLVTIAAALVAAGLPAAASAATLHPAKPAKPASAAASAQGTPLTTATSSGIARPTGAVRAIGAARAAGATTGRPSAAILGSITGVVRGAAGSGLRGVCVTAAGSATTSHGVTAAGGRYVIGGLQPGAYTVGYRDCAHPGRYFDQWYGGADLAAGAARVTVGAARRTLLGPVTLRSTSPLAAVAATRQGIRATAAGRAADGNFVSGTVRTKSGTALADVCVLAEVTTADNASETFALTGRDGGYRLPIGTSGKVRVSFFGGCGNTRNFAPQWWRHAPTPKKATDLRARPHHDFRNIDAALVTGAAITGTVRAASGSKQVLKGVCVDAQGLGAMSGTEVQTATRANGSYVLKYIGTGRYRVSFSPGCGLTGNYLTGTYHQAVSVTDGTTRRGINGSLRLGGEMSGVVTSQATSAALAGICVSAVTGNGGDGDGDGDFFAISSKTGSYRIDRLTPGRYQVDFQAGCGNSGSYQAQGYDGVANPAAATTLTVAAGQVLTGIDAAMLPGATISGHVTDTAGAPVQGACVLVTSQNDAGGFGANPFLAAFPVEDFGDFGAATGPQGNFTVPDLLPGLYSVEFTGGCGHDSDRYAWQLFTPQAGHGPGWISAPAGVVTSASAVLRPGGSIAGVVTGQSGKRLSGVCVTAVQPGSPASAAAAFTSSDETRDGTYQVAGLAPGKYAVQFTPCGDTISYADQWYQGKSTEGSAALVTVRSGHTTGRIGAALVSGGTITGQILSGVSGKPVPDVCVLVVTSGGALTGAAVTGKSGRYQVTHVPAGRWTLDPSLCLTGSAVLPGLGEMPALAGLTRHGVVVRNGSSTGASFRLPAAGRITGTVTGGAPAAAEPGLCVEATPSTGAGEPDATITNAQGGYTLGGLAAGRYRVLVTPLCVPGTAALVPQWYNGQPASGTATPVSVTAGATTAGVNASLVADGGISGTVTGSPAAAVAGVCVGAYAGTSSTPTAVAITGADGSYQLGSLPPRTYTIEFSAGCGAASYTTQWFSDATSRAAATPVTVTAGAVTGDISAG